MGKSLRAVVLVVLALLSCVALGVASALTAAVTMAATALIVPPTGIPDANIIPGAKETARDYFMGTTPCNDDGCDLIGINYSASFWPFADGGGIEGDKWNVSVETGVANLRSEWTKQLAANPDEEIVIGGYSQGARVVSIYKENLANLDPDLKEQLSIVLIASISRPHGGVWSRFNFLGHIPILDISFGNPTPTDTGIATTDTCLEHDGVCDFPLYVTNGLGVVNALAGLLYFPHAQYLAPIRAPNALPGGYTPEELAEQMDPDLHPENFAYYGDTTYITIPSPTLPIVKLVLDLAEATGTSHIVEPIVELSEPVLRWRINQAYDRSINPGEPTPIRLFRIPFLDYDPFQEAAAFVDAVQKGIADATDGVPLGATVAPETATTSSTLAVAGTDQRRTSTTRPATGPAATPVAEPATKGDATADDGGAAVTRLTTPTSSDDNASARKVARSTKTKSGSKHAPGLAKVSDIIRSVTDSSEPASKPSTTTGAAATTSADSTSTDTGSSTAASTGTGSPGDAGSATGGSGGDNP